ncbi:hypothetical protein HAX54_049817 [Datura stramonium]|uniref:Uncharacterized protein n=1 Tax=Datura stramonium TaxID=4076 RepID=A0ABS8SVH3_DATST|nr:hypothetical protein [Datura stramonium]
MHDEEMAYECETFDKERTPYEYDQDPCFQPPVRRIIGSPIHKILENKIREYAYPNIENKEEEEATLINVTKMVNALYILDFHMSQNRGYDDTPIIYFDDAFEIHEEDPFTSCLAVTTISGKVLCLEPRLIIGEDIHDDEKQCPNLDAAPREMQDETSSDPEGVLAITWESDDLKYDQKQVGRQ